MIFLSIILFCLNTIGQNNTYVNFSIDRVNSLTSYLMQNKNMIPYYPTLFPFNSKFFITSDFGHRPHPVNGNSQYHSGIDFSCPNGTEVFAPANGRVLKVVLNDPIIGNSITISHLNDWTTSYSHLKSINVVADQLIQRFDVIGYTGNTGLVTGSHLHYSIYYQKKAIDPLPFCYLLKYLNDN